MNQQAIQFNNKGVEFLRIGRYENALDMFLGSIQAMLQSVQAATATATPTSSIEGSANQETCIRPHIDRALIKYDLTIEPKISPMVTTEDKQPSQYIYSKAFELPCLIQNDDDEDLMKLCTAIALFNTGLVHQLRSTSRLSMEKSIKLYEKACNIISGIEDIENALASWLILALMNNMVQLYKDLGYLDLAHTYLDRFTDFVASLHSCRQSKQQCSNSSNVSDDNPRMLSEEEENESLELLLNAKLSVFHPSHVAGAA